MRIENGLITHINGEELELLVDAAIKAQANLIKDATGEDLIPLDQFGILGSEIGLSPEAIQVALQKLKNAERTYAAVAKPRLELGLPLEASAAHVAAEQTIKKQFSPLIALLPACISEAARSLLPYFSYDLDKPVSKCQFQISLKDIPHKTEVYGKGLKKSTRVVLDSIESPSLQSFFFEARQHGLTILSGYDPTLKLFAFVLELPTF